MTKKEKEKILLDGLGLKVGDIVSITHFDAPYIRDYKIIEDKDTEKYLLEDKNGFKMNISTLFYFNFTKTIPKKKKGELLCKKLSCNKCPLDSLRCCFTSTDTLYNVLDKSNKIYKLPKKAYEAYKEILDKEVENDT